MFVNGEHVRLGFARAAVIPPNLKHEPPPPRYEREASQRYAGLWQEGKKESEPYYVGTSGRMSSTSPPVPWLPDPGEKQDHFQKPNRSDKDRVRALPEVQALRPSGCSGNGRS